MVHPGNLSSVPFDIHALICSALEPYDILLLRRVCKSLADSTSHRSIWRAALERVCYQNDVYFPSFPVSDMSRIELEYASMAPKRWAGLFSASQERTLPAARSRRWTTFADGSREGLIVHKIYLIPGGRFLVTLIKDELAIWDLGHAFKSLLPSPLVAQPIAVTKTSSTYFVCHPSPNEKDFRIVGYRAMWGDNGYAYDYNIFEVNPSCPSPAIRNIASIHIPNNYALDFTSICKNRLVMIHLNTIKIWNFVDDEWATWHTSRAPIQILMTDRTIVLIDLEGLSIWDIPKMSPDAQKLALEPESSLIRVARTTLIFPEKYRHDPDLESCSGICDWYTGSPQPLLFDFLREEAFHFTVHRFRVNLSDFERTVSAELVSQTSIERLELQSWEPYRVCGDKLVILSSTPTAIECHLQSSSTLGEQINRSLIVCDADEVGEREFSFCPVAGRLCWVSRDIMEIKIVDCLTSPLVNVDRDL
ncbi:hypothetical protein B0H34DRAFT_480094 [Crassisporium funariophilum]|nr:hypothetical protein B0H34DRAFT_480094 [Crassisporium funariophilum]